MATEDTGQVRQTSHPIFECQYEVLGSAFAEVMGDNSFLGISIISVLLSRYDNNHDNYIKPKKAIRKCESTRQTTISGVFLCSKHIYTHHTLCSKQCETLFIAQNICSTNYVWCELCVAPSRWPFLGEGIKPGTEQNGMEWNGTGSNIY